MLVAVLLTVTKNWKQPKCPSAVKSMTQADPGVPLGTGKGGTPDP